MSTNKQRARVSKSKSADADEAAEVYFNPNPKVVAIYSSQRVRTLADFEFRKKDELID